VQRHEGARGVGRRDLVPLRLGAAAGFDADPRPEDRAPIFPDLRIDRDPGAVPAEAG
jgi:hypothetical protein